MASKTNSSLFRKFRSKRSSVKTQEQLKRGLLNALPLSWESTLNKIKKGKMRVIILSMWPPYPIECQKTFPPTVRTRYLLELILSTKRSSENAKVLAWRIWRASSILQDTDLLSGIFVSMLRISHKIHMHHEHYSFLSPILPISFELTLSNIFTLRLTYSLKKTKHIYIIQYN